LFFILAHFASVCHDPSALQALRAIKEFLVDNSNGDINQERFILTNIKSVYLIFEKFALKQMETHAKFSGNGKTRMVYSFNQRLDLLYNYLP